MKKWKMKRFYTKWYELRVIQNPYHTCFKDLLSALWTWLTSTHLSAFFTNKMHDEPLNLSQYSCVSSFLLHSILQTQINNLKKIWKVCSLNLKNCKVDCLRHKNKQTKIMCLYGLKKVNASHKIKLLPLQTRTMDFHNSSKERNLYKKKKSLAAGF